MNWKKIGPLLKQAHKKTKRAYLSLIADMAVCFFQKYTYADYFAFDFPGNRDRAYRESFACVKRHYPLITKQLGVPEEDMNFFEDKGSFNRNFRDFHRIESLDLRVDGPEEWSAFLKKHDSFFLKTPFGSGGDSVTRKNRSDFPGLSDEALYQQLKENGQFIVEEPVQQHPDVARLSVRSVNTLRVFTAKNIDGEIRVPFVVSRIATTNSVLDNASQGGAYSLLGKDGTILYDYYGHYPETRIYAANPATGFVYRGFQFPYYEETLECCKRAAALCKTHLIGWDVAIAADGPCIIEANTAPGTHLFQGLNQLENHRGRLAELEQALGIRLHGRRSLNEEKQPIRL